MNTLASVITCFHHRDHYLAQTIESVLNQSHPDFEYILYGNGASDCCVEIAKQYAKADNRIHLMNSDTNQGLAPAWQAAINFSQGRYFGTVDDDDLLNPTALEQTIAIAESSPTIGVVYTNYRLINALGCDLGIGRRTTIPYSPERLLQDFMTFHFRLVRRSAYNQTTGINPQQERAVDYDLCLKLSEVTEFYHLPEILYAYRRHPHTMSSNIAAQNAWAKIAIEAAKQRRSHVDRT